jgi:hypothetical protein
VNLSIANLRAVAVSERRRRKCRRSHGIRRTAQYPMERDHLSLGHTRSVGASLTSRHFTLAPADTLRARLRPDNLREAGRRGALSGASRRTHAPWHRLLAALAIAGIAMALTACGASNTTGGASSRPAVVTTVPGNETCEGRAPQNDASPDFYRQQYADGLANPLKERLKTYESAAESGDAERIGQAAGYLDSDIRADAHLPDNPRLFGCYDRQVLARLHNTTETFATTLDALSCAGDNKCNRKQAEVPGLVAQAGPQERAAIEAFNAYAAQFAAKKLPLPSVSAGPRGWRL